jgi:hypothetical protein
MTNSNLFDCITGRSAGFAPFEDAARINADLMKRIHNVGSVAHQSTDFGNFTVA